MSNYRFRDVTEDFDGEQGLNSFSDISYVVPLAVIKMRLVAMYESLLEEVHASGNTCLGPDGQVVGRAELERKLANQRRQLIALLDVVQGRNTSIVPALLYPEPLMRAPTQPNRAPGTLLEAQYVLHLAMDLWHDIPGSDRFLQTRFRTATPSYPTS